ncbi:hypothetical protein HPB51_010217 [Rhipicephalus microplus]|uniref:Uncharacterized protein n=1 Tax=Rhipicephalus microplus TaxID=6941 RepID=A0A9J6F283_RHIMP|nr:hypothetical protein HPB51_010217 [Rhipicephalus microplus]
MHHGIVYTTNRAVDRRQKYRSKDRTGRYPEVSNLPAVVDICGAGRSAPTCIQLDLSTARLCRMKKKEVAARNRSRGGWRPPEDPPRENRFFVRLPDPTRATSTARGTPKIACDPNWGTNARTLTVALGEEKTAASGTRTVAAPELAPFVQKALVILSLRKEERGGGVRPSLKLSILPAERSPQTTQKSCAAGQARAFFTKGAVKRGRGRGGVVPTHTHVHAHTLTHCLRVTSEQRANADCTKFTGRLSRHIANTTDGPAECARRPDRFLTATGGERVEEEGHWKIPKLTARRSRRRR